MLSRTALRRMPNRAARAVTATVASFAGAAPCPQASHVAAAASASAPARGAPTPAASVAFASVASSMLSAKPTAVRAAAVSSTDVDALSAAELVRASPPAAAAASTQPASTPSATEFDSFSAFFASRASNPTALAAAYARARSAGVPHLRARAAAATRAAAQNPARRAMAVSTGAAIASVLLGHPAVWAPTCARLFSTFSKVGRVEGKTAAAASKPAAPAPPTAAETAAATAAAAADAAAAEEHRRAAREAQLRREFPEFMADHDRKHGSAPPTAAATAAAAAAAAERAAAAAQQQAAAAEAEAKKKAEAIAAARAFADQAKAARAANAAGSATSSSSAPASSSSDAVGATSGAGGDGGKQKQQKQQKRGGFRWRRLALGLVVSLAAAVAGAIALDERIGLAIRHALGVEHIDDNEEDEAAFAVMPIIAPPEKAFVHPLDASSWLTRTWFRVTRLLFLGSVFLPLAWQWFKYWRAEYSEEARKVFLEALVERLERAGCSFLKFGQWLSMRPDMFPPDVIAALSQMRDNAPSHSLAETERVIREQFGAELSDIFEEFHPVPVASGSIAQVYRGKLTPEWAARAGLHDERGRPLDEVAVKVRHPAVLEETWMDVDLIFNFVNSSQVMTVPFNKDEFSKMMQKQVDFRWEGHYLTRFAYNFREEVEQGHLKFPAVSAKLLGEAVLVEAWAQGKSVANIFSSVGHGFLAAGQVADHGGAVVSDAAAAVSASGRAATTGFVSPQAAEPSAWESFKAWGRGKQEDFQAMTEALLPAKVIRRARQARRALLREGEDSVDEREIDLAAAALGDNGGAPFDVGLMVKKKRLAFTMFDMFLKMFLRDNLIHGDLHAGNVLFDTAHSACTVLDAGLTVSLDRDVQASFGKFLLAVCSGNAQALVDRITDFEVSLPGQAKQSGQGHLATNPAVRAAFAKDMDEICERFFQTSKFMGVEVGPKQRPKNVSIGDVVGQVLFTMQRHNVVLRGDVATSIMAMSVCEGLIRQLDPTLDIVLKSLPYFVKYKGFSSVSAITL